MLLAQQARHGLRSWQKSDEAYDSIQTLTRIYNQGFHNQGKWLRMMDCQPRRLPVFEPVIHQQLSTPSVQKEKLLYHWNGADATHGDFTPCEGLGYEGKAVEIKKGKSISFDFSNITADSIEVELRFVPTHPINGTTLRFILSLDKAKSSAIDYATQGRSEEWKENVLRNQAVRKIPMPIDKHRKSHRLSIKAIDEGITIDQVLVK